MYGLYQVELTAFCDMKCSYCPHPTMARGKGHMSEETLGICIEHAKRTGLQRMVLHHFGEPLLHPKLRDRLMQVADAGMGIQFSTNGLLLEKRLPVLLEVQEKLQIPMRITLSMHQWADQPPGVYFAALEDWRKRVEGKKIEFEKAFNATETVYHFHKWLKGEKAEWDYQNRCFFLTGNWVVVMWNGDVIRCCADCEGDSTFTNVHQPDWYYGQNVAWSACVDCDIFKGAKNETKIVAASA
jgi:organic radical activating enzyme